MKFTPTIPQRKFQAGRQPKPVTISDCASIELAPDEQVTFRTAQGAEYDVARKSWGFYATPSLNGRLKSFGLRPALARSGTGQHYILLLERGNEAAFEDYLASEEMRVVCWLDDEDTLAKLGTVLGEDT